MRSRVLLVAFVSLGLCLPAAAKPDKGWGPPPHAKSKHFHADVQPPRFSAADTTRLRVYFAEKPVVWTGLPPGLARNYGRGKPLPPGIAKKLPPGVLANLPHHQGYEYARVGQDVVLVEAASQIVVDVIERILN
ncbi:MAG: hypothetical protein JNK07_05475 [Alphaproteobacteria bacterium]|nr:hypothetical protein [Alphaproteobacteria bacterium]